MAGIDQPETELEELPWPTITELQAALARRELTSLELVGYYSRRIQQLDWSGPQLRAVLEINPEAAAIAVELDRERREAGPRGPLHGIPVLLKDNIDTADRMLTTAGSWALVGSKPPRDAWTAHRLRQAGAILLGKTNLTEWSSFRSRRKSSGWSGRGGQCRNPYALDHSPFGSSSGSAVAVAAGLCAAALGTETDGSIVNPAHACGVVGLKPTVGLTSRAGIIPISHTQDTVGPLSRTVRDAAIMLGILAGPGPSDPAAAASAGHYCQDYTRFLDEDGLRGMRIGVARQVYSDSNPASLAVLEEAINTLRRQGALVVDPADIPTAREIRDSPDVMTVLSYEFKHNLQAYLAARVPDPRHPEGQYLRGLEQIIAFNIENSHLEMRYFGQEIFEQALARGSLEDAAYRQALANNRRRGGRDGIDAVMSKYRLDALIAPTGPPAWRLDLNNGDPAVNVISTPASLAGYPVISVPAGYAGVLPAGLSFTGKPYSEPLLLKLAYAFEQATRPPQKPQFLATIPY